jgi:hypothetical protein
VATSGTGITNGNGDLDAGHVVNRSQYILCLPAASAEIINILYLSGLDGATAEAILCRGRCCQKISRQTRRFVRKCVTLHRSLSGISPRNDCVVEEARVFWLL